MLADLPPDEAVRIRAVPVREANVDGPPARLAPRAPRRAGRPRAPGAPGAGHRRTDLRHRRRDALGRGRRARAHRRRRRGRVGGGRALRAAHRGGRRAGRRLDVRAPRAGADARGHGLLHAGSLAARRRGAGRRAPPVHLRRLGRRTSGRPCWDHCWASTPSRSTRCRSFRGAPAARPRSSSPPTRPRWAPRPSADRRRALGRTAHRRAAGQGHAADGPTARARPSSTSSRLASTSAAPPCSTCSPVRARWRSKRCRAAPPRRLSWSATASRSPSPARTPPPSTPTA